MCIIFKKLTIALFLFLYTVYSQNNYPIVLVHGFAGWGPDEIMGYKYWGGFYDIEEYLENKGYTVYTVSMGPVSSNWDRAIELYYQLKGGQLDYGKMHADEYGIIQQPEEKIYEALYPEWDAEHPVHLIGHSMGGQTARMLEHLLENKFYSDSLNTILEESDLLGKELKGWVKSITSLSTPHNGTTYVDVRTKSIPFAQNFIGVAAAIGTNMYNFDLEQWELEQKDGEAWQDYYERINNHPVWESKNISTWDLSIDGARELNTHIKANPNIYYFSFATFCSKRDKNTGYHIPKGRVYITLRKNVVNIGQETAEYLTGEKTDSTWFENDGVVNTVSMWGPTTGLNGPDMIVPYDKNTELEPGKWYTFPKLKMDHYYVIGQSVFSKKEVKKLNKIYSKHCNLLHSLPK